MGTTPVIDALKYLISKEKRNSGDTAAIQNLDTGSLLYKKCFLYDTHAKIVVLVKPTKIDAIFVIRVLITGERYEVVLLG